MWAPTYSSLEFDRKRGLPPVTSLSTIERQGVLTAHGQPVSTVRVAKPFSLFLSPTLNLSLSTYSLHASLEKGKKKKKAKEKQKKEIKKERQITIPQTHFSSREKREKERERIERERAKGKVWRKGWQRKNGKFLKK